MSAPERGYYGLPVLKSPVWTWQVPLYFLSGGIAGGAAILAAGAWLLRANFELARAAILVAFAAGGVVSPILLVMDLGRPARFLNMLRVFKWRSPMSIGVWTLVAFSAAAGGAALVLLAGHRALVLGRGSLVPLVLAVFLAGAAISGAILATYTGVLIGATAIPVWHRHRTALPVHFGVGGLGSAAAILVLLGFRDRAVSAVLLGAAVLEAAVSVWLEASRHGAADRALRTGTSGAMIRGAGILSGPLALILAATGVRAAAAVSFVLGSLLGRYGWLVAGKACARDPSAALPCAVTEKT